MVRATALPHAPPLARMPTFRLLKRSLGRGHALLCASPAVRKLWCEQVLLRYCWCAVILRTKALSAARHVDYDSALIEYLSAHERNPFVHV